MRLPAAASSSIDSPRWHGSARWRPASCLTLSTLFRGVAAMADGVPHAQHLRRGAPDLPAGGPCLHAGRRVVRQRVQVEPRALRDRAAEDACHLPPRALAAVRPVLGAVDRPDHGLRQPARHGRHDPADAAAPVQLRAGVRVQPRVVQGALWCSSEVASRVIVSHDLVVGSIAAAAIRRPGRPLHALLP